MLQITLYAPWVHSLKEKRSEVKSLVSKLRNRFNISVCEAATQDIHQTITIGIAALAMQNAAASQISQSILRFIEQHTDAEIIQIDTELL